MAETKGGKSRNGSLTLILEGAGNFFRVGEIDGTDVLTGGVINGVGNETGAGVAGTCPEPAEGVGNAQHLSRIAE